MMVGTANPGISLETGFSVIIRYRSSWVIVLLMYSPPSRCPFLPYVCLARSCPYSCRQVSRSGGSFLITVTK